MPQSTLVLKSSVTRRQAAPVPPDMSERLEQLKHHQAASTASTTEPDKVRQPEQDAATDPEAPTSSKQAKREAHALQAAFLASNLNRPVAVYLLNGVRLNGTLREYDQYCILIEGPDGVNSLTFKHAVSTIAPDFKR